MSGFINVATRFSYEPFQPYFADDSSTIWLIRVLPMYGIFSIFSEMGESDLC